ncbi:MAG TPA: PIN domain-containing protein [Fimbriimonas sp.]|nr:PIN domain-containing protein [Fimbriimonas sp.]
MSARCFLDTNILLYAIDSRDPRKQELAEQVIQNLLVNRNGCISAQIAAEFSNNLIKKFRKTAVDAIEHCTGLRQFEVVGNTIETVELALQLVMEQELSFWDGCVVAAALESNCSTLFTEDMQHGRKIGPLTIVNPFLS